MSIRTRLTRPERGHVRRLAGIARSVGNLLVAEAFYRDALGFELLVDVALEDSGPVPDSAPVSASHPQSTGTEGDAASCADAALLTPAGGRCRRSRLVFGHQRVDLACFEPRGAACPPQLAANDPRFQHVALVVADIDAAWRRLRDFQVQALSVCGPQTLPPEAGGVQAWKFRDLEGHALELLELPAEAAAGPRPDCRRSAAIDVPRIDHSAIVVTDVERSVDCYDALLGLRVASRQCNQGPEPGRLDALADPTVDVLALEPLIAPTPHVELLGYRQPHTASAHVRANPSDLIADRLLLEVDDLDVFLRRLRAPRADVVAVTGTYLSGPQAGVDPVAALVRDPDGHCLVWFEARSSSVRPQV